MPIPFFDLTEQTRVLRQWIRNATDRVIDSHHYINGEEVRAFENDFAQHLNAKYAVGVSSGTDALMAALMALEIGPGDIVLTTPYTFVSTVSSIVRVGARPLFVDIDPQTFCMSVSELELIIDRISTKEYHSIRAILPVHLYGQCLDMDRILSFAKKHKWTVIEDAAQAAGGRYKDRWTGALGDIGCFSFYPTKNLGCMGDGGMVVTNNSSYYERLIAIRNHGSTARYIHEQIGGNFRLDELQAAILSVKLPYLDHWVERRQDNAVRYGLMFAGLSLTDIIQTPESYGYYTPCQHAFNQYVIRVPERNALRKYLMEKGIGTEVYYPMPLHLQHCFRNMGHQNGDFPVAEAAAGDSLALPMYPELTRSDQLEIVSSISNFYAERN
jgi:dTDP-4-amino-4,6-dideoxygalactose transaminase